MRLPLFLITTAVALGVVVAAREITPPKNQAVLGTETQMPGKGIRLGFFRPEPDYFHIIHDMGSYHFGFGADTYDPQTTLADKDYEWIAKAFNTAVIGYPGPGINDIPAKAAIQAATKNNVWVIIAGGNFDYIAQKIAENPHRNNIIGYRIFDEFVPSTCEKRRYPASYPGLGPPCTLAEFITEGQEILKDIYQKIRVHSEVPLILDFIPVELTYSADNPSRWARERPGNSNDALTGYLQTCTIDWVFLAMEDESQKGGKSLEDKIDDARNRWGNITCLDGSTKQVKIGVRNGGGGFDTKRFSETTNGNVIIKQVTTTMQQAYTGGADSDDLYPWWHKTPSLDRKTLDIVPCQNNPDPDCYTAETNDYYSALVSSYEQIQSGVLPRKSSSTPSFAIIGTTPAATLTPIVGLQTGGIFPDGLLPDFLSCILSFNFSCTPNQQLP